MSVALVDIRATLERAEQGRHHRRRALSPPARRLAGSLLSGSDVAPARARGRASARPSAASRSPPGLFVNAVAQKKADARALVELLALDRAACEAPKQVEYHFEYTEFWRLASQRDGRWGEGAGLDRSEALLDELRLDGVELYAAAARSGHERSRALAQALSDGFEASVDQIEAVWAELITRHGLDSAEKRQAWCRERGLEGEEFVRFLREEAAVIYMQQHRAGAAHAAILDHLRLEGRYPSSLGAPARSRRTRAKSRGGARRGRRGALVLRGAPEERGPRRLGGGSAEARSSAPRGLDRDPAPGVSSARAARRGQPRRCARSAMPPVESRFGQIGPYQLERAIARTAQALLYQAKDVRTGQEAAVKVALPTLDRALFRQEKSLLARLKHPNIVSILDSGMTSGDGSLWYAMEFVREARSRTSPSRSRSPRLE